METCHVCTSEWPALIRAMLEAGAQGPDALAEAGLRAARELSGAEMAALVWFSDGQLHLIRGTLFSTDLAAEPLAGQLPDGASWWAGHPMAVASIDPDTKLVAARPPESPEFDPPAVEALRAIATLMRKASNQPREALSAVYGVATKVLASLDLDEVLLSVANAAAGMLRAEIAGIFLLNGNQLEMRCAVGHHTMGTATLRVRPGQGLAGKVLATGCPQRVDDYKTDPSISKDFLLIASEEGTQSALAAPMQVHGRTIGVVCVWRRRVSVFTNDDERLLVALADMATIAVDNARLYETQRTQADRLREAHAELDRRFQTTQRALHIHRELTKLAVGGAPLRSVVQAVCSLTEGAAALVGESRQLLAACPATAGDELVARLNRLDLRQEASGQASFVLDPDGSLGWLVCAPVRAAGVYYGCFCLAPDSRPAPEDIVAAEQAATVCALLLAREEAAMSAARGLQSEFIWDLLEGRLTDTAEVLVRARHLGYNVDLPARVFLLSVRGLDQLAESAGWSPDQLERGRSCAAQALAERLERAGSARPLIARRADLFAAVMPRRAEEPAEAVRKLGRAGISPALFSGLDHRVGVSALVTAVAGFPEAFREAQVAMSATSPSSPVSLFDDLGVLQLLLAPAGRRDLERFARKVLGPLLEYDQCHGTELVCTLQAYLAADCNLQRAAKRLFVHHKTMRYRLQRMEELSGLQLERQESRFEAQLALRILALG